MSDEVTTPEIAVKQTESSEDAKQLHLGSDGKLSDAVNSPKTSEGESTTSTQSAQPPVPNCTFCRIIAKQLPSEIVYEDPEYVCFVDRSPASTHHYLIVPRQHIRDARALSVEQLPVIEKMAELGKQVLTEKGGSVEDVRMGFHWPPFLMVRHLHMHVISPASRMGWLHRNIVFRTDSLVFTSPTATLDYLRKCLNK